ncbi:MAG: hypothetical protein ACR2HR_01340 [Euzebya sp.]
MSTPEPTDDLLAAWLSGDLDAPKAQEFSARIRRDPELAARADAMATVMARLDRAATPPPSAEVAARLDAALAATVAGGPPSVSRQRTSVRSGTGPPDGRPAGRAPAPRSRRRLDRMTSALVVLLLAVTGSVVALRAFRGDVLDPPRGATSTAPTAGTATQDDAATEPDRPLAGQSDAEDRATGPADDVAATAPSAGGGSPGPAGSTRPPAVGGTGTPAPLATVATQPEPPPLPDQGDGGGESAAPPPAEPVQPDAPETLNPVDGPTEDQPPPDQDATADEPAGDSGGGGDQASPTAPSGSAEDSGPAGIAAQDSSVTIADTQVELPDPPAARSYFGQRPEVQPLLGLDEDQARARAKDHADVVRAAEAFPSGAHPADCLATALAGSDTTVVAVVESTIFDEGYALAYLVVSGQPQLDSARLIITDPADCHVRLSTQVAT